jgi:IclR family acetate operon transcriptional repressor
MFAEVGRSVYPHCTAVGKVLLAALPDAAVGTLLDRTGQPRRTAATLVDREALLEDLRRVRARGWGLDDGEEEEGVRCLAVPVVARGRTVAALSTSGPAERLPYDGLDALAARLREVADAFARSLG